MSLAATRVRARHDAVEVVQGAFVDAEHDQTVTVSELRASAEYAPVDGLGVTLAIPVRAVASDITFLDATGDEIVPDLADVHHRDETLAGVGDPVVGVHVAYRWLGVRAGTSVPLGGTEPNPFAPAAQTTRHQHVQFGTGTFTPTLALEVEHPIRRVRLGAWASTTQSFYENGHGYQAGDRYGAGVSGVLHVGARTWTLQLGAELAKLTAERWDGAIVDDEGNGGRLDVLLGASASRALSEKLALVASVTVPLYTEVVGAQLDYPAVVGLGVRASLEPSRHRMARPVVGKITVVDYWASWCPPCRELHGRLDALVADHPDRLAVTRIQVEDADYPLPFIKVFDAGGRLLLERAGDPPALEALVREALAR